MRKKLYSIAPLSRCQGKTMCDCYTSPEWLGNPCIGVAKFLTVKYDCRLRGKNQFIVWAISLINLMLMSLQPGSCVRETAGPSAALQVRLSRLPGLSMVARTTSFAMMGMNLMTLLLTKELLAWLERRLPWHQGNLDLWNVKGNVSLFFHLYSGVVAEGLVP